MKAKARERKNGMSGPEAEWEIEGVRLLGEFAGFTSAIVGFEPVTFKVGQIKYTPDFEHIGQDGQVVFVEVKESKMQKGYRYSKTRARLAADAHPEFYFLEAVRNRGKWELSWLS